MDIYNIINYLKYNCGHKAIDSSFYRYIDNWYDWYRGFDKSFHTVVTNNGLFVSEREMYRLYMAKNVCEDWANMLLNEKTYIVINDKASSEFLQGTDGSGGVLGENNFWARANRLVEKTFALGTGAIIAYLDKAAISSDGELLYSPEAKIRLDFVDAKSIIPLSYQGDNITEAAFVSEITERGENYIYLQIHALEDDGYVISSRYLKAGDEGLEEAALPVGISPVVRTGSGIPWFCILRPNTENNVMPEVPMGISIFANSTDVLKGIDLCYDSLNMDFYLGKKMVFMRKDLLSSDEEGNYYPPQDANRQLFMYIGDKTLDGDMIPKEFNPLLRVEEHIKAIQQQLNYLSGKCGLGERHYRFDADKQVTATQIISENVNLYRSIRKHEIAIERPLISLARAILWIAKEKLNKKVKPDATISISFDDSIIEDRASEQARDIELMASGIMKKWEYRSKYFGEDEKTAKMFTENN